MASGVVSGTIANGAPVAVQSDGKFVTVTGTNAFNGNGAVYGAPLVNQKMTYDTANDKVILKDKGYNNNTTLVYVGTPSADGKTVSWGTGVNPNGSANANYAGICYDSANNKIIVTFIDEGGRVDSVVGTVSGTSITWGSIVNLSLIHI